MLYGRKLKRNSSQESSQSEIFPWAAMTIAEKLLLFSITCYYSFIILSIIEVSSAFPEMAIPGKSQG